MTFERGRDVKTALDIGIAKKLPIWMKDSEYNYEDYWEVWNWALTEKDKGFIFPYIIERREDGWITGGDIIVGMEDNNALLWESVAMNCLPAVKACLKVEGLFANEIFSLDLQATILKESFLRGDRRVHYRGTSFGAFVELAMKQAKGNFEIQDALMDYYKKYSKDAI